MPPDEERRTPGAGDRLQRPGRGQHQSSRLRGAGGTCEALEEDEHRECRQRARQVDEARDDEEERDHETERNERRSRRRHAEPDRRGGCSEQEARTPRPLGQKSRESSSSCVRRRCRWRGLFDREWLLSSS
jgi:hypothetical protein